MVDDGGNFSEFHLSGDLSPESPPRPSGQVLREDFYLGALGGRDGNVHDLERRLSAVYFGLPGFWFAGGLAFWGAVGA